MEINIDLLLGQVYSGGSLLLLYIAVFIAANFAYAMMTSYSVKEQIVQKDNTAAAVSLAGYLFAVSSIFVGCVLGESAGLLDDLITVAKYSGLGIALLYVAHVINDKLILSKFDNAKEIVDNRNVGVGAVQAGSYIASGLIVAGSVHGDGGGLETALVFFALGQVCLIVVEKIYDYITSFHIHEEIENDNAAAGIAFSGTLVAIGIILAKASSGDFVSWNENLSYFFVSALVAFIVLPVFRVFIDKIVIRGEDLNKEISVDKNVGAGILEFSATVSFAIIICFVV